MLDLAPLGKFPWGEIFTQTIGIVLAYFSGRYRSVSKNQKRRKDDI